MERMMLALTGGERPVRTLGDGPTVLCLNGLTQTTANWTGFARRLAPLGYRVVLTDLPGQGSVNPLAEGGPKEQAHALIQLLDAMALDRCHVLGFSFGGRVAQELLNIAPHRMDRCIFVSTSLRRSSAADLVVKGWLDALESTGVEGLAQHALPWIIGDALLKGDLDLIVRTTSRRNSVAGIRSLLVGLLDHTPPHLSEHEHRCLVVAGERDRFTLSVDQKWAAAQLTHGAFIEIPNVGHTVPVEAPDALAKAVDDFLSQGTL
ncbi:MAG: hypothetical protein CMH50_10925 [Myxococcales bacterium]|nr:hypothetical protein [Myxococcales bacterium]